MTGKSIGSPLDEPIAPRGASRANWLVLHLVFYAITRCGAATGVIRWQVAQSKQGSKGVKVVEQVVRLTVNLTINEGQAEVFKSIAQAMTEGSKSEPGTLGYEWFAKGDGKHFTLLETYVDSAAIEDHFTGPVVQEWVPKLAAVCAVNGFEIYGDPGPKVAAMAAGFGANIFRYWMGIDR